MAKRNKIIEKKQNKTNQYPIAFEALSIKINAIKIVLNESILM